MTLTVTERPLTNIPFDCQELVCYFTDSKGLISLSKTSRTFREFIRSEKMKEFLLKRDYGFTLPSQVDFSTSAPSQYYRRLSGIHASRVSGLFIRYITTDRLPPSPETCGCFHNMKDIPPTVVTTFNDYTSLNIWTFHPMFSYKKVTLNTQILKFQITPDGTKVIVNTVSHLHLLDIQTGNYIWMVNRDLLRLTGCNNGEVFLDSWKKLEDGSHDKGCYEVLDLQTGNIRRTALDSDGTIIEKYLDGKKHFCLGYRQGSLGIFDYTTFDYIDKCAIGDSPILHAKMSPDGTKAVVVNSEPSLKVWDLVSGKCLMTMLPRRSDIHFLQISPDATRAILAYGEIDRPCEDRFVLIDLKNGVPLGVYGDRGTGSAHTFETDISRFSDDVLFTSDGLGLVAGREDQLCLYNFYPLPEDRLRHESESETVFTSDIFLKLVHCYNPTRQVQYWPKDINGEIKRLANSRLRLTFTEEFILYNAIHETLPAIRDCLQQVEREPSIRYKHLLLNDVRHYFLHLEEPVQQVIYINLLDILREKGLLPETVPAGFEKQIFSSEIECPLSIKKEAIDRALNEIRMKAELPPIPNTALPTLK